MNRGFAFHEPQAVIDDDEDGLPIVAVYPAGAAYEVIGIEDDGWVLVLLPSPEGEFESSFPEYVGTFSGTLSPAPATLIPYRDAAPLYPDLITPENLEDYEAAAANMAQWR